MNNPKAIEQPIPAYVVDFIKESEIQQVRSFLKSAMSQHKKEFFHVIRSIAFSRGSANQSRESSRGSSRPLSSTDVMYLQDGEVIYDSEVIMSKSSKPKSPQQSDKSSEQDVLKSLYKTSSDYGSLIKFKEKPLEDPHIIKVLCGPFIKENYIEKAIDYYFSCGEKEQETFKDVFRRLSRAHRSTSYSDTYSYTHKSFHSLKDRDTLKTFNRRYLPPNYPLYASVEPHLPSPKRPLSNRGSNLSRSLDSGKQFVLQSTDENVLQSRVPITPPLASKSEKLTTNSVHFSDNWIDNPATVVEPFEKAKKHALLMEKSSIEIGFTSSKLESTTTSRSSFVDLAIKYPQLSYAPGNTSNFPKFSAPIGSMSMHSMNNLRSSK